MTLLECSVRNHNGSDAFSGIVNWLHSKHKWNVEFGQMRLAIWKNTFWKLDKVESIEGNHNESDGFGGIANWLHSQLSVLRRLLLSERHRLWLKTFLLATRPPVMKWVIPQFLWPLYKKFFCQYLAQIEVRPSVCSLFLDWSWFMSTMWLSIHVVVILKLIELIWTVYEINIWN